MLHEADVQVPADHRKEQREGPESQEVKAVTDEHQRQCREALICRRTRSWLGVGYHVTEHLPILMYDMSQVDPSC